MYAIRSYYDEYFLFWRTRPTLMIGRFQNTIQEINPVFAKENNIDIIRRNSGGGTVYTDADCWQFSFITWKNAGQVKDFRDFTKPVVEALRKLGVNAEFSGRNDLHRCRNDGTDLETCFGREQQWHPGIPRWPGICFDVVRGIGRIGCEKRRKELVITSYSIHYTKLYECR